MYTLICENIFIIYINNCIVDNNKSSSNSTDKSNHHKDHKSLSDEFEVTDLCNNDDSPKNINNNKNMLTSSSKEEMKSNSPSKNTSNKHPERYE